MTTSIVDVPLNIPPDTTTIGNNTDSSSNPYPKRAARLVKEYVAAGIFPSLVDYKRVLSRTFDDAQLGFGDALYDFMDSDPIVGGSLQVLILAILSNGMTLNPAKTVKPGEDVEADPDAKRSAEVLANNQRLFARLGDTDCVWRNMLRSMAFGSKLAELVWEEITDGEDKGKWGLLAIKPKPRTSWSFVVDAFYNTWGILGASPVENGWAVYDVEKFLIMSWDVRDGDPRGNSIYRRAYPPWNIRIQTWPQYYRYLQRFASPGLIGTTSPDSVGRPATDGTTGAPNPDLTDEVSPEEDMLRALTSYFNGTALALPHGSEVTIAEAKAGETAFERALDLLKREIVMAILLQARATVEAEHGSKADSSSSEDIVGNIIRFGRNWLAAEVKSVLVRANTYNYGPDVAATDTPEVSFGSVEHQDLADIITAIAQLMTSDYFTEDMLPAMDAFMGFEPRKSGTERTKPTSPPPATGQEPGDNAKPGEKPPKPGKGKPPPKEEKK